MADATEEAIVIAGARLDASVTYVVDFWNAKLRSTWRCRCVLLVRRHVGLSMLSLVHSQAQILCLMAVARTDVYFLSL